MAIFAQFILIDTSVSGTITAGVAAIAIYDGSTGLPTNGNNCTVTFQTNINGTVTNRSIDISGLYIPVYEGVLNNSDPLNPFYSTFTVLTLTEGTGIPPDPAADDLVIINVITTPETAIGADDGTVTINATSSFPAITYSLDNITYQPGNVFTGRISGLGTAWAKDTNGGLVSKPYTVPLLGNILVSDPSVNLGNGNLSRWNAVFNPIWFKYQRKDYEVTGVTEDVATGNIIVAVNADMTNVTVRTFIPPTVPGQPSITSDGDFVYINTALYQGSYEVLGKTTGTLILNCPYNGADGVGFININSLRPSYKIQTIITFVDPITGKFNSITSTNYPFPDGHCNVDLSSFLQSLLRAKDYSTYSLINYRDMQISASYTISYAEMWNGSTAQWVSIARPYYITWTARQIQQLGGGNMQEFVPYPLGFQPAKWVTDFLMPVYNYLFPFDIGFIFSEYMVGLAPFYTIILLDINKSPLPGQSVTPSFLLNENGTFILNEDGSKFIIAAPSLQAGLVEHVGLNRLLVNFTPVSQCWYFSLQLFYTNTPVSGSPTTYPLTQAITCRIDQSTTDRQVYFRWIGLTGCWQYYTFVYNQTKSLEVSNTSTVKNFVTDWQNTDTIAEVLSKHAGERITVYGENISVDDIKAIRGLKISPKCQIYIGPGVSGTDWQTINSGDESYEEYETFINAYSVSISFMLPEINIQFQ